LFAWFRCGKREQLSLVQWAVVMCNVFEQAPDQDIRMALSGVGIGVHNGYAAKIQSPTSSGVLRSQDVVRTNLMLDDSSAQEGVHKV
jgi:hypothetical protein